MGKSASQIASSEPNPLWYKDALLYETHVRAFADSNGDGIGDFQGLKSKLDYVQDLGVTAIWLLPFYPSPLKDDGYDIADYYAINPIYGTLDDFREFLAAAHARNLRVITELVVNHTSDQHPWFQKSRRAKPGDPARDYYVWSDTPERYREARIIFRDFEPSNWSWDSMARAYYWHRFYSHQPDLNFDNPAVHREILNVLDFWLGMGVDGLRLDAIPYLYEREGTSCENLPETHEYLKSLRAHVDAKYGDRLLLAEANQWPEDAVTYFGGGKGDECHMAFHFPLMPRMFMSLRMEDRTPIVDILEQTPAIPETSQWALFLRNHDELTLEMVTDEERDYMYRVYAHDKRARINLGIRRRLAPLLGNDRRRIELLNLLLFSLPGTPVLYYGDEIGMGDNVFLGDRNGVRTPMQWSSDKNAGFSRSSPHALYLPIILDPEYHYEAINAEAQQQNPSSLLWWTRRVINLRRRHRAFGHGSLEFLHPANRKVLAFLRQLGEQTMLVVANLSRFTQPLTLDLSRFAGRVPLELFGSTRFPDITHEPYALTLGPHLACWFELMEPQAAAATYLPGMGSEPLSVSSSWEELLHGLTRGEFEGRLATALQHQHWFRSQDRGMRALNIREAIALPVIHQVFLLLRITAEYSEGDAEDYFWPLAIRDESSGTAGGIARLLVESTGGQLLLTDAATDGVFGSALLRLMGRRLVLPGLEGTLHPIADKPLELPTEDCSPHPLESAIDGFEPGNAALVCGNVFLKLFRRMEPGLNPDMEMRQFLVEHGFKHVPEVLAHFEYRRERERYIVGLLTPYYGASRPAREMTMRAFDEYTWKTRDLNADERPPVSAGWLDLPTGISTPPDVAERIGHFLEGARRLGAVTGQLHRSLASDPENPDFAPEPFTPFYQRSLFQSLRNKVIQTNQTMAQRVQELSPRLQEVARTLLQRQDAVLQRLKGLISLRIRAQRIRCHGHLHLGQVLTVNDGYVFIDFEGEAHLSVSQRRIKVTPLRDIAGMVRSFDITAHAALSRQVESGELTPEQASSLDAWTQSWHRWVSASFVSGYLEEVSGTDLLPAEGEGLRRLMEAELLRRTLEELAYCFKQPEARPEVPLRALLQLTDFETG